MINLKALKSNLDLEIESSKAESKDTLRCTLGLVNLLSEGLAQAIKSTADAEEEKALLEKQFEEVHDIIESNIRAEIADNGSSCKWCENKVKADTVRKMQERLTKEFDRMHKSNFITVEVRQ